MCHMAQHVSAADLAAPELRAYDPAQVASVALKAFFNLAREWELARDEQVILLGGPSVRTYHRWKVGDVATLPRDTLERISVLLGIYKAVHILLPVRAQANSWVKRANKAFGGETALDVMLKGRVDHLYRVRRYLDAWRG